MDRVLTWFIWIWVGLIMALNAIAIVGMFANAESFWAGVARVRETYSPFNVANFLVELIVLSPAIIAYWWRERRRERQP